MEPRFVYKHMAGHTLVNDLHRTLKELYHSRATASADLIEPCDAPQRVLHKFRIGKLRSSPGNQRPGKQRRMVVDQPICPVCCKVKVPRLLVVSSQEMQEKQCICDTQKASPKNQTQVSIVNRKTRISNKHQKRGKSVSDMSKNSSEKSLTTYQINTAVLKLMPLNPSQIRLAGVLRPNLLDIHRISASPKQSLEDDSLPEVSKSAIHDFLEPHSRLASVIELDTSHKFVVYPGNNSRLISKLMFHRQDWTEGKLTDAFLQFAWHPTSRTVRFDRFVPYQGVQIVNHFEGHAELSNKLNLFHNLQHYCEKRALNILDFMPLTFSIEFESNRFHAQYTAFTSFFKTLAETGKKSNKDKTACLPPTHNSGANIWLLKPSGFNRGRGIYVFSTLEEFKAILDDYHEAARVNPKSDKVKLKPELVKLPSLKFVIQKYIERPLLIHTRKFDIRMWVLLTHEMHGYMYREGYLRTSSEPFTLDKALLGSQFVHLTNNAVQKNGPMYGKFEDGNQVSFAQFQLYLDGNGTQISIRNDLFPRMKSLAKHSLSSVPPTQAAKKLNPQKRTVCFELFGYDFILDEDLGLWLIEVNTNPCLELSSPLLEQLIPSMLDDMLKLTVDKLFPTEMVGEVDGQKAGELQGKGNWEHVVTLGNKAS